MAASGPCAGATCVGCIACLLVSGSCGGTGWTRRGGAFPPSPTPWGFAAFKHSCPQGVVDGGFVSFGQSCLRGAETCLSPLLRFYVCICKVVCLCAALVKSCRQLSVPVVFFATPPLSCAENAQHPARTPPACIHRATFPVFCFRSPLRSSSSSSSSSRLFSARCV